MDRRFARASAAGAALGLLLFAYLLTQGTWALLEAEPASDFYDAQAEAWVDGRWDIDPDVLGIERFEARGRSYMYQGPVPALLRLPVAALSDGFTGRLSRISMLLALTVASAFVTRLHWQVRTAVRGRAPLARGELLAAGAASFAATGGGGLLYVASRAWVYHEAVMWGVAFTIGAVDALVSCTTLGLTRRRIVWASLLAALAVSSRVSVGLGAVAGLALLTCGQALHRWSGRGDGTAPGRPALLDRLRWLGPGASPTGAHHVPALALATIAPMAAYGAANWIKFRSLFSVPFAHQGISLVDPMRQEFLAANDGAFFGLQFVPTTLAQYLRPDAVRPSRAFPFVDLAPPVEPVGDVTFDLIDWTGSIPSTLPALVLAALVGAWVLIRPRRDRGTPGREGGVGGERTAALRVPALAALAGGVTILPFGYIAQRYVADVVPVAVLLGLVGLQVVLGAGPSRRRQVALGALALTAAATTWVNLGLGLLYQRQYSPNAPRHLMAQFLDTRYDVPQALGLDPDIPLRQGQALPRDGRRGDIFVVGDCAALYLHDGVREDVVHHTAWNAVERGRDGGHVVVDLEIPAMRPGERRPLMAAAAETGPGGLVWIEQADRGIRVGITDLGFPAESDVLPLAAGDVARFAITVDPWVRHGEVVVDGARVVHTILATDVLPEFTLGRNAVGDPRVEDQLGVELEPAPDDTSVCRELLAEAG